MLPTVVEPLRSEWREVQAAALTYEQQGKLREALAEIRAFHRDLCAVHVLDALEKLGMVRREEAAYRLAG